MKNKLNSIEDQLQEIIESNKQIKAISSVLNENWEELSGISRRDSTGCSTHYEVGRVLERTETLFYMLITLNKETEEKNKKVLNDIAEIGRELV